MPLGSHRKGVPKDGKVVGSCDGGTKKIIYKKG